MTDETLLLRQVNPAFIQNGQITSQVFKPTPKDEGKLSVYDGDQIEAEDAYQHFTKNPECRSMGVLAVSVIECHEIDLTVQADPAPFPEHVVILFGKLSNGQIKKKSGQLKRKAEARNWLFRAG